MLPTKYILNRIKLLVKKIMKDYYSGKYICPDLAWKYESNLLDGSFKCPNPRCRSKLESTTLNEKDISKIFMYLKKLFDIEMTGLPKEVISKVDSALIPFATDFGKISEYIESLQKYSEYDKVDLAKVFSYMNKYKN